MTEAIILIKISAALLVLSPVAGIITHLLADEKGKRWWE